MESDGAILVATSNFYVSRYDGQRFRAIRLRMPDNAGDDRRRVVRDHRGEWWTVATGGVFRFAGLRRFDDLAGAAPVASYNKQSGLASDDCMRLLEDTRGDVWFGYRLPGRQVLTRWERASNTFHHYSDADGLPAFAPVRAMVEDRSGAVWIAFWEGGLARYRDGRFIRLTEAQRVSETALSALYLDRAGGLWFSSADRIGRIDHPEAATPEVSRIISGPFSGGGPQMVVEDDFGHLYFGSVNGIDRLDPRTGTMRHYSTLDGLASNEVVAGLCDRDGTLWFTTTGGVSRLRPARPRVRHAGPTLVTAVVAGGRTISLSDLGEHDVNGLTIGPGSNQLRIEFAALSFSGGEPVRYRYMLEAADRQWVGPGLDRSVQYANLAPGQYRFLVEAVPGEDRAAPGGPATVAFTVLAPVWQRWWFVSTAIAVIALVLAAFHQSRVARLLAVERVRTRIATDLHDELGASLSRIAVLSEVVKGDLTGAAPDTLRRTDQIAATARDLLSSTNDLVWSIHPRRDTVKGLVTRVRSFATELLEGRGIGWTVQVAPDVENVPLSAELRWHLLLILKEALHNVVRHSGARQVVLTAGRDRTGRLTIELRDDGRGLTLGDDDRANEQGRGHGLRSMEARANEIGGRLTISPGDGAGTTVTVRLPG